MSLADFLKKKDFLSLATVKVATVATVDQIMGRDTLKMGACVANVAGVSVANLKKVKKNDTTAPDPDRHSWPHTEAANTAEMSAMSTRLATFARIGLPVDQAEKLADKLLIRDREGDDRHACLECGHLSGRWRCAAFRQRGATAPGLPADYVQMLTRCNAWRAAA